MDLPLPESGWGVCWPSISVSSVISCWFIHEFGIEQEETEITEKEICHCLNRAGAYVGLPALVAMSATQPWG